jgi:hypothetical protein
VSQTVSVARSEADQLAIILLESDQIWKQDRRLIRLVRFVRYVIVVGFYSTRLLLWIVAPISQSLVAAMLRI